MNPISHRNREIERLEAENKAMKLALLNQAAWIFSYSETSALAKNALFYDLWLRYGFEAAKATGMFVDWKDRRIMFEKIYEEIHKLQTSTAALTDDATAAAGEG